MTGVALSGNSGGVYVSGVFTDAGTVVGAAGASSVSLPILKIPEAERGGAALRWYVAGAYTRPLFQLNVSAFCGIGSVVAGCVVGVV